MYWRSGTSRKHSVSSEILKHWKIKYVKICTISTCLVYYVIWIFQSIYRIFKTSCCLKKNIQFFLNFWYGTGWLRTNFSETGIFSQSIERIFKRLTWFFLNSWPVSGKICFFPYQNWKVWEWKTYKNFPTTILITFDIFS